MPDLFSLSCTENSKKHVGLEPSRFSYNLGEECITCGKKVLYNESITPCSCFRYCHEACLIKNLEESNPNKEENIINCTVCNKKLQLFYMLDIVFGFNCKMLSLTGMILSLLIIISSVFIAANLGKKYFVHEAIVAITLAISLIGFIFFCMNILMKKQFKLWSIKSTKLGLIVSAFADLEFDIHSYKEEETECEMNITN